MSRIIKRSDPSGEAVVVGSHRHAGFVPLDYRGEAAPIPKDGESAWRASLETVSAEAERIIADARAQAVAITKEAMARGYADGRAEGLRAASEQCKEYLDRIADLARHAKVDRDALVQCAEHELAALALAIAEKVIRREVSCDPALVLSIAQAALEKAVPGGPVRILVHPDDAELLRSSWPEMRGAALFSQDWEVVGDEKIERGGCVIETRGGSVDARITTQLRQVAAAFEVEQCPQ